jgi:hypothetical protein
MRASRPAAVLLSAFICLAAAAQTQIQAQPQSQIQPQPTDQMSPEAPGPPPPAHEATADQIRELLGITHALDMAHKLILQSLKAARATSAPYYTAAFWDDMEKSLGEADMLTPSIAAYQRYLSQEDAAAAIAFYKTDSGRRVLEAQPLISAALESVMRVTGQQIGAQVGLRHRDEIQRLMKQQLPVQTPATQPKP